MDINASRVKSVLVVEDDAPLKKKMEEILAQHGFRSLWATDGLEGLKLAIDNHPDLIILDILLPRMDGLQLLNKLREEPSGWGKGVPVIVLTNIEEPSVENEAVKAGISLFFQKKDISPENLISKINERLGIK